MALLKPKVAIASGIVLIGIGFALYWNIGIEAALTECSADDPGAPVASTPGVSVEADWSLQDGFTCSYFDTSGTLVSETKLGVWP